MTSGARSIRVSHADMRRVAPHAPAHQLVACTACTSGHNAPSPARSKIASAPAQRDRSAPPFQPSSKTHHPTPTPNSVSSSPSCQAHSPPPSKRSLGWPMHDLGDGARGRRCSTPIIHSAHLNLHISRGTTTPPPHQQQPACSPSTSHNSCVALARCLLLARCMLFLNANA